jgi:hypothetical protein
MTGQKVHDVMTPEVVVVVAPGCGFKHIVDVLADFKVSAVPVVEDGTLVDDTLVSYRPGAATPGCPHVDAHQHIWVLRGSALVDGRRVDALVARTIHRRRADVESQW